MEKSRKPKIRFKGFTDDWEQRKLGDVVKEITRNDPESEAPIMMITANNGFIEQSERYAFNNAGESLKKYILLKKGELAYNHGASKLRPYGSCFALTTAENARIPFVYHCFSAENQNAEFMSIELNGAEIENQLRKIVSSGARMDGLLNISFDEYTSVSVLLPGTEEQDRIADFFRHLDNLITLHQRKLDKLVNVKKSMLEKMFPKQGSKVPNIRFAGFADDWEQRKLEETNTYFTDGNYGEAYPKASDITENGVGVPFLTGGNLKNGLLDLKDATYITLQKHMQLTSGHLVEDDIVIAVRGSLGSLGYVNKENSGWNINSQLAIIRTNKSVLNGKYLIQFLSSDIGQKELLSKQTGSALKQLPIGAIRDVYVPMTSVEEQILIGDYFRSIDHLITLHQRKLEKLKNIKKSMLDKMFI